MRCCWPAAARPRDLGRVGVRAREGQGGGVSVRALEHGDAFAGGETRAQGADMPVNRPGDRGGTGLEPLAERRAEAETAGDPELGGFETGGVAARRRFAVHGPRHAGEVPQRRRRQPSERGVRQHGDRLPARAAQPLPGRRGDPAGWRRPLMLDIAATATSLTSSSIRSWRRPTSIRPASSVTMVSIAMPRSRPRAPMTARLPPHTPHATRNRPPGSSPGHGQERPQLRAGGAEGDVAGRTVEQRRGDDAGRRR